MHDIVDALRAQQAELDALVAHLDDDGWRRPTPCDGWDVAAVVLHLAQTNEMATGSAEDRFDAVLSSLTGGLGPAATIDEGAALMVERDRGAGPASIYERWQRSNDDLARALLAREAGDRVTWVAGQLSAQTLATTRIAETWIHTGDVAAALRAEQAPTERLRLIARLAWRTLPYAFAREGLEPPGPVAFHLTGPAGEPWDLDPPEPAGTTITGPALDLCLVAGRRADPAQTSLRGTGPGADAVLALVRTYA